MKSKRANEDKPAIELIEEAFHLLRHASPAAWGAYVTGTLPFILLLLYFWSDMARSAFAHVMPASSAPRASQADILVAASRCRTAPTVT